MSWQKYVLVVLLWPLIGLQNHLQSILTQSLRTAFLRFPARCRLGPCCSSLWPTYSIHEKFWPTSENCLCLQILGRWLKDGWVGAPPYFIAHTDALPHHHSTRASFFCFLLWNFSSPWRDVIVVSWFGIFWCLVTSSVLPGRFQDPEEDLAFDGGKRCRVLCHATG